MAGSRSGVADPALNIAPTSRDNETLASWYVRFSPVREDSGKLGIHYRTTRRIGFEQSLHEGFTETVPFSRNLSVPLTLAPNDLISPDPMGDKIVSRAKPILAFCLDDPPPGMETLGLLAELGQVNRTLLPDFGQRLLAHPPEDMRGASSWSRVFFRMRATKGELKLLLDSPNPLLQATARDARNE